MKRYQVLAGAIDIKRKESRDSDDWTFAHGVIDRCCKALEVEPIVKVIPIIPSAYKTLRVIELDVRVKLEGCDHMTCRASLRHDWVNGFFLSMSRDAEGLSSWEDRPKLPAKLHTRVKDLLTKHLRLATFETLERKP